MDYKWYNLSMDITLISELIVFITLIYVILTNHLRS